MRAEHTEVTYSVAPENVYYDHNDRHDYFELFPNAKLTYRLSQANRLIAAYNRRVDRPTEADLRIFPEVRRPGAEGGEPISPAAVHPRAGAFARSAAGSATASLYHRDITDAYSGSTPLTRLIRTTTSSTRSSRMPAIQADRCAVASNSRSPRPGVYSGSVNVFRNEIDAFETILLFPQRRPFALDASTVGTWDATVNNRFRMPRLGELNLELRLLREAQRAAGRQRSRSSPDVAAAWPVLNERAELLHVH